MFGSDKVVLFDLDGLLVNSEDVYKKAWMISSRKCKLKIPVKVIENMLGKSYEYANISLKKLGYSDSQIRKLRYFREEYIEDCIMKGDIYLLPGVKDFLDYCSKKCRIGLCTSSNNNRVNLILNVVKIGGLFDIKVTYEDTFFHKPHKEPYSLVLKKFNINSDQAIAFEDSLSGIKSAQENMIETICVNTNFNDDHIKICGEENCFKSFEELINQRLGEK